MGDDHGGYDWEDGWARQLGLSRFPEPRKVMFEEKDVFEADKVLSGLKKPVCLHLWSCHARSKSFDPEKIKELTTRLKELGYDPILFGWSEEPGQVGEGCLDIRGKLSVTQSACLLSKSVFSITVDSWSWHMSRVLGLPHVGVFGSMTCDGSPEPWDRHTFVRGRQCSYDRGVCRRYHCSKTTCMDTITVEDVMKCVSQLGF